MTTRRSSLGFNATGVVETQVAVEDGQIILTDTMPAKAVQHILDSNNHIRNNDFKMSGPSGNGVIGARVPITEWQKWRDEWKVGPKLWGVTWDKFLTKRLNSPAYKNLRFMEL